MVKLFITYHYTAAYKEITKIYQGFGNIYLPVDCEPINEKQIESLRITIEKSISKSKYYYYVNANILFFRSLTADC